MKEALVSTIALVLTSTVSFGATYTNSFANEPMLYATRSRYRSRKKCLR